jgi:hypothetical protein
MKPDNTNPPILLCDNAPIRCQYVFGREECEQNATTSYDRPTANIALRLWADRHPRSPLWMRPGSQSLYLCDTHTYDMQAIIQDALD